MALTRPFRETVQARLRTDPEFSIALQAEYDDARRIGDDALAVALLDLIEMKSKTTDS
jgi:hypothetical protein